MENTNFILNLGIELWKTQMLKCFFLLSFFSLSSRINVIRFDTQTNILRVKCSESDETFLSETITRLYDNAICPKLR